MLRELFAKPAVLRVSISSLQIFLALLDLPTLSPQSAGREYSSIRLGFRTY